MKLNKSFVYKLLACFDIFPIVWMLLPLLEGKSPLLIQQYQQVGKLSQDFSPIGSGFYVLFAIVLLLYVTLFFSAKLLWQQNAKVWKLALLQLPLRFIASTPSIPFFITSILPLGVMFVYPIWLMVEIGKIYCLKRYT